MLRFILIALAVTTILGGFAATVAQAAQASTAPAACSEAYRYAASSGAQDCRDAGWVVRPRLVVTPQGRVAMSTLPHCRYEDGSAQRSACSWNFGQGQVDGNGIGRMLWIDRQDRFHFVKGWL